MVFYFNKTERIFYFNVDKEASASRGLRPPDPLPGLCPGPLRGHPSPVTHAMFPQPWGLIDAYVQQ